MSYAIIRGDDGRRHEVEFGESPIVVELHTSGNTVELVIEAEDDDRPSDKCRFVLVNIPRHLFSKALANLARQGRARKR